MGMRVASDKQYYPFVYRLDGQIAWLLYYYSDDGDGFDRVGMRFRSFDSLESLKDVPPECEPVPTGRR
jgi:hypothetical protein